MLSQKNKWKWLLSLTLDFIRLCMILAFSCILPGMPPIEEKTWGSQRTCFFSQGKFINERKKHQWVGDFLFFLLLTLKNRVAIKVSVSMTKTLTFWLLPGLFRASGVSILYKRKNGIQNSLFFKNLHRICIKLFSSN